MQPMVPPEQSPRQPDSISFSVVRVAYQTFRGSITDRGILTPYALPQRTLTTEMPIMYKMCKVKYKKCRRLAVMHEVLETHRRG